MSWSYHKDKIQYNSFKCNYREFSLNITVLQTMDCTVQYTS